MPIRRMESAATELDRAKVVVKDPAAWSRGSQRLNRVFHVRHSTYQSCGMTLVELLIVIAVAGVLASVAWPIYQGYLSSSRESAMLQVMQSVKIFEEDRRVRLGEYLEGAYDPSNPSVSGGLATTLEWNPTNPDPDISIVVACATHGTAPECARDSAIEITATHAQGETICRSYNGTSASDC